MNWGDLQDVMDKNDPRVKKLIKYLDTILLWSGYECYLKIEEIAEYQRIKPSTVTRRIQWFKENFPKPYEKVKSDRDGIKRLTGKLDCKIKDMLDGKFVSYDTLEPDTRDALIKEKF